MEADRAVWAELPSAVDARFAAAPEALQSGDSRKDSPAAAVPLERVPKAASAAGAAGLAVQLRVAMRSAAEEAQHAAAAASPSRFESAPAADSTKVAAATRDARFPVQRVGRRVDSPGAVWPFPHNGDIRSSMAEHRGRTAGTPN